MDERQFHGNLFSSAENKLALLDDSAYSIQRLLLTSCFTADLYKASPRDLPNLPSLRIFAPAACKILLVRDRGLNYVQDTKPTGFFEQLNNSFARTHLVRYCVVTTSGASQQTFKGSMALCPLRR
jgi:hypothetical protein